MRSSMSNNRLLLPLSRHAFAELRWAEEED